MADYQVTDLEIVRAVQCAGQASNIAHVLGWTFFRDGRLEYKDGAMRAIDRSLQRARRKGLIRCTTSRRWEITDAGRALLEKGGE